MDFHVLGSMGMKMPKIGTAKMSTVAQDIAWFLCRGFDQPFTLRRRGGNVCSVPPVSGSGATRPWLLTQQFICKTEKGSMAGHGPPSHSLACGETPGWESLPCVTWDHWL